MANKFWLQVFSVCIAVCLLLCLLFFVVLKPGEVLSAEIYVNGELIRRIDLRAVQEPYELTVAGERYTNIIRVTREDICVLSSDCPDKTCVTRGALSAGITPIVCLPNKLVIRSVGLSGFESDAESG